MQRSHLVTPYYCDDFVTIYHGDCREIIGWLEAEVLIAYPPYGVGYDTTCHDEPLPRVCCGWKVGETSPGLPSF